MYLQNFDELVNYVTQFLICCPNSGIRLRLDKSKLAESAVNFAGVRLSQTGYIMQDKTFTAIRDIKTPQCLGLPTLRLTFPGHLKGGESSSQFRWFTIAKIEL